MYTSVQVDFSQWILCPSQVSKPPPPLLGITRSLAVAAHDLDFIRLNRLARVLHLESNVLNQESPDLVAETICIEVTLPHIS